MGAVQLFELGRAKAVDEAALTSPLYEEIGRLKVELDWLKKKLTNPVELKRKWIEPELATNLRRDNSFTK